MLLVAGFCGPVGIRPMDRLWAAIAWLEDKNAALRDEQRLKEAAAAAEGRPRADARQAAPFSTGYPSACTPKRGADGLSRSGGSRPEILTVFPTNTC
jgi:hypothetical protein